MLIIDAKIGEGVRIHKQMIRLHNILDASFALLELTTTNDPIPTMIGINSEGYYHLLRHDVFIVVIIAASNRVKFYIDAPASVRITRLKRSKRENVATKLYSRDGGVEYGSNEE